MPRIRNWEEWDAARDERQPRHKRWDDEDASPRLKNKKKKRVKEYLSELPELPADPTPAPAAATSASAVESPLNRRHMQSLLAGQSIPAREAPAELTPLQLARAVQRSGNSPRQIYKFIKQGTPIPRLANALGMPPELVQEIYQREQAVIRATGPALQTVKLRESGLDFPQIGEKLKVSEAEARNLYARGHVTRYGSSPAVQYGRTPSGTPKGRQEGTPFPADVFQQPTYLSDANRNSAAITGIVDSLRRQLQPHGYSVETTFEADAMGGRHVVKVVQGTEVIGQPFRLSATPNGAPLISKTGRPGGGYRLTQQGQETALDQRLGQAALQMAANHNAYKVQQAAKATRPVGDDAAMPDLPDWMNQAPAYDYGYDEGGYAPDISDNAPAPPPLSPNQPAAAMTGNANGRQNVLDLMNVRDKGNDAVWRQISAGDFMRLSHAGRYREENAEALAKDQHGQWTYPEGLAGFTPIVSKGTVYPLEARNYIAGNVELETGEQWGSQAKMGKQIKRDELSLTRKYWQAGPALGVAYEQTPQHILGQRATEPEMAYTARAFILDRGGIIPEGQMWKDPSYAPWVFGAFEQAPEKYELRFDPNYSDEEVLRAAGLWDETNGGFKPRLLKNGDKVTSPSGFKKNILGNHEAGVINDYEIVETLNERGLAVKALRFKGYFGDRPNVASAMKLEGWKNLVQDKHIRQKMGINADLITNKPSDAVVANLSMLNAMPRNEFEDLWREVHGDTPAPTRTATKADMEALAPVWQRLQEKNRATEIIPGQVVDADTLQNYLKAGIVRDNKYEELPPLFEGAEPQYKLDLIATGYYAPVRTNFITDVTNLRRGHLSNEILRNVEHNFPGLGEHLRDLGYQGRDIYNTLFEMHQLNTHAGLTPGSGYQEYGSPVVDLIGDLTHNKDARAGMESLYEQRLADILPETMRGLDPKQYTPEQQKAYDKFQREASGQAIRQYYDEALGTDSYIFRLGGDQAAPSTGSGQASYMVNPGLVERFGFVEEETNEQISQLQKEGDYQLESIWQAIHFDRPYALAGLLKKLPGRMKGVIANQEQLLASAGARKKWFGTSDSSIRTHVHASDYGLPRNAMAMSWDDIFHTTGLKRTKANRAYLNKLSRAGQLPYSGIRNPASDPVAQTGTILNMLTPDILKAAGLDIPTTGRPVFFHPHQVQAQGGDNDSDQSQVYLVLKQMAGELVNSFGLQPSDPALITERAKIHAAGEYKDAVKKLGVTEAEAHKNLLGFDPTAPAVNLTGSQFSAGKWQEQTLEDYKLNARQIGQAYNIPIRVGTNLAENPAAKELVSQYGGWLYQNPLDKANYQPGSPEDDLFSFFTSFDAFTGSFAGSDHDSGRYYSYRPSAGFENRGQFGAAGLLAIVKRLTENREGTKALMTREQAAAFMTGSSGDLGKMAGFIDRWSLPEWGQLDSQTIKNLKLTSPQQKALQTFAMGDSPLAQMMRGYAVRTAIKSASRMQFKLQGPMQDPVNWEGEGSPNSTQFKGSLRNYLNIFQNELYNRGRGSGSADFKQDYETFNAVFGQPNTTNWFKLLEPGNKNKGVAPGEFYNWPAEKRQKFYKLTARLLQKHVTGYGQDEAGHWVNLDPSVSRNNPMLKDWYEDYDRIRDMMAVNARERDAERDVEGYAPTLTELDQSEVTGPLVREKYRRKQKMLGGLGRLFEVYQGLTGQNGSTRADRDFENFILGKKPYTVQEEEMFRQAELGHQEAYRERFNRFVRQAGYKEDEPLYFAEGGIVDRPTRLGETRGGQDIVGGEAGREYVVPEGKTKDLGGGLKLFDEDELGRGASEGTKPVMLAKGGVLDYEAYANAPTNRFEDAIKQVAWELTGGAFTGDVEAAKNVVRQRIEADIQRMAVNPPQNGLPGLMASDISGRATDLMAMALGPNPARSDFSTWNDLLSEYGLSADVQPVGVSPQQIDPATKKQLLQQAGGDAQAYKTALAAHMKQLNAQLAGKGFSHANYGNVYNAIPGWQGHWNGPSTSPSTSSGHSNRPPSTVPAIALSQTAQGNLARLIGGAGGGGNQPPPTPGPTGAPNQPSAGQAEQAAMISFTKPLNGKYVEQLETVVKGLGDPSLKMDIIQAAGTGTMLPDLGPEHKGFVEAASGIQTSYQRELARAQRVIEKFENQEESRDVRRLLKDSASGRVMLSPDEGELLTKRQGELKAHREGLAKIGMTQRVPETEYLFAQRVKDLLTSGAMGGVVSELDLSQTGQDAQALLAREGFTGSFMSSGGARFTVDPKTIQAVQAATLIKNRSMVAKPELEAQRLAEKNDLRLAQLDQREGDLANWYRAIQAGEAQAFSNPRDQQMRDAAVELSSYSGQRQALYERALPLKQGYHAALASGDIRGAQRFYDELAPLADQIDGLKDQIGALTPHVKEHVDTLKEETATIRDQIKEHKATYSAMGTRADTLRSQAIGLPADEKQAKLREAGIIEQDRAVVWAEIKQRARLLGQKELEKRELTDLLHEPQGRAITGLGQRPQTYSQQAWNELAKGYDPQRLFWQFQNMQQLQYMAFMPMLNMRDQYLSEQAAMGQAQYALGAGQMPQSVLSAMASQANMSRASSSFGRGVDKSMAMNAWKGFTSFLAENEGAGSFLGAAGFDLTSLLTATMGAKMLGGPMVSAIGKLAGAGGAGLTAARLASIGAGAGGAATPAATGLSWGSLGLAATGAGGLLAGGLGLGLGAGIYSAVRPEGSASLSEMATTAAYGLGGYLPESWGELLNGGMLGKWWRGEWNQERATAWGKSVGEYTGAVTDPIPVWVTKIESEVAKQLGTTELPFDQTELAQMIQMAAEDQGITRQQLETGAGVAEKLAAEIAESYTSGVSMNQRSQLRQKAIDVSGYAPGTAGARQMSEWVQQGSLFERQQRLQAASMSQNLADLMDYSPQQRQDLSQHVYDLLAGGMSQAQVSRSMQQRAMSNQYYWSAAAYEANLPQLAIMDEEKPWMSRYQQETWDIEDRRRGEDQSLQFGRGGQELAWQQQKLDLEEQFWQFRRKSQLDDFAMQQKLFDFNIRQQRLSMEWEEKQSRSQSSYYEKQYALNKEIFELQSSWQRADFDKQEVRLDTQRSWEMEDSTWNRETFELQAGWQQEDLQRALRYASSGRERMDIRRQIERTSIMQDRQRTEMDREDDRAGTKYGWAKEDLAEAKERFEELNDLQRQQMELGREYWQEQQSMSAEYRAARRAMMEEQIVLQQQQNALNIAQFQESMRLADEQHALETQINETKQQWALADLELARQRAEEDEIILGWQRETANASSLYAYYQAMGYETTKKAVPEIEAMAKAAGDLADDAERYAQAMGDARSAWEDQSTSYQSLDPNAQADAGMTPAPSPSWLNGGFAAGGYTGDGALNEVAGIVHRGEYVVPNNGALVLREQNSGGSAEVVALLVSILAQLQTGGGTILIDEEKLKQAGFLHSSNFDSVYR